MDIEELIRRAVEGGEDITQSLKEKSITVPKWEELEKEYNPKHHPVMDTSAYPDVDVYEQKETDQKDEFGNPVVKNVVVGVERVTRITYSLQALAVKRITELCFGIPVQRKYTAENKKQEEVAKWIEKIYKANHINSVNIIRGRRLYASCEIITIWYAVKQETSKYGFKSKMKLKCATYSPMQGDSLYPLYDEMGDLVAMSVEYTRKVKEKEITYFDTYTDKLHLRWSNESSTGNVDGGHMNLILNEEIIIGKIPGVYTYRPLPVWEDMSNLVEEQEWSMSRNGNFLRKNSRPILGVFTDDMVSFNKSPLHASRDVEQLPQNSRLEYITWNQAIDNLKYYNNELRQMFFTLLQLPDWSYENMKTSPMSGEARKQLFIDCQLKVKDEEGIWLEFFDREINVIKAWLKVIAPAGYEKDIDALEVENIITPYTITSKEDKVSWLVNATGGKQIMAQATAINELGMVDNPQDELNAIQEESQSDIFNNPSI